MAETREGIKAWLLSFYEPVDSLDGDRWISDFYTDDAMLRFVNNSPLQGADAIKAFFTSWLANLDVIEHEIVAFDVVGDKVYQEVTVSYVVKGDETREKFTIPGMAVMHRTSDGKKVRQFDVYLNPSDVVKRMGDVASKNL